MQRFALVGYGAIAEEMIRTLEGSGELGALAGVLVRPSQLAGRREQAAGRFAVVDSVPALAALKPGIVVEAAGHDAMREHGDALLGAGLDLVCSSVGVLAERSFGGRPGDGRLLVPSGAIAGIDGLLAARTAGLARVTYTSAKPPVAWKGTPAEALAAPDRRVVAFEGSAREAARLYPKNVNIGVAVALAGIGLDRTVVRVVSDPALAGPLGTVEAEGEFGTFRFEVLAYASPRNPKTSLLTAHSLIAAVRDGVCFEA